MIMARIIESSELIINSDGSVFHLHLRPEQLADKIILVGDPSRVDLVAERFDRIDFTVQNREFRTVGGQLRGHRIMCLSHGIGPDNIDIVVNELDALANVDFTTREVRDCKRSLEMVRIGTSGSLQPDIPIGTPVIAAKSIGFDGVLNYYEHRNDVADLGYEKALCEHTGWNPMWARPYVVSSDPGLVKLIGRDDMTLGNTISAVGFYGPQGRELRLPLANPDINSRLESFSSLGQRVTNYEMESAPLQGLSLLMGHRAMTVCSIIANRMNGNATPNYRTAVVDLIDTVLDRFIP